MSSVAPDQTNEAGGLQGTAQNLGASLGTALIGAILLSSLSAGFSDRVTSDPAIPPDVQAELAQIAETEGLDILPLDQVEAALLAAGVAPDVTTIIVDEYSAAEIDALKASLLAVAIFAVIGLWFTRRLPDHALGGEADEPEPATAAAPA